MFDRSVSTRSLPNVRKLDEANDLKGD